METAGYGALTCAVQRGRSRGHRGIRSDISDSEESWMQTSLQGEGTVTFWWKVSSESGYDELEFYLDDVLKHSISGEVDWQQKSRKGSALKIAIS